MGDEQQQFDLLGFVEWPRQHDFPLNREGTYKVESQIRQDFENSDEYLIITGFASLEYLIEFLGRFSFHEGKIVRIVLGNEPIHHQTNRRIRLKRISLSQEIKEFWLEQGISLLLSKEVIQIIELIRRQHVEFYILDNLHAKIYVGENYALMGSSNFSKSGLRHQKEANIRFSQEEDAYHNIKKIAQNYYKSPSTQEYNDDILRLLKDLLQKVRWEEALARAIAELLEGEWVTKYPNMFNFLKNTNLWPSQRQAIAQALWILDNYYMCS